MSEKHEQSRFRRRMGNFRDGLRATIGIAVSGFGIVVIAFVVGRVAESVRFFPFEDVIVFAFFLGVLLLALGIIGTIILAVFAVAETGASGIDWVFGQVEQSGEKSKRKMKPEDET